jgi:large subunit ribosomal protein L15
MPLQRRLPKRGFRNPFRREYVIVNLAALARFPADSVVDPAALAQAGFAGKRGKAAAGVKILGKGQLDRKLTVKAHAFSESAKAAIEARGGSVEVIA